MKFKVHSIYRNTVKRTKYPMLNILKLKLTFRGHQSVMILSYGGGGRRHGTYFNLSLSSIRWMVLENLDSNNLIGAFFPALYNL
jgi:hypothetical protein